MGKASKPAPHLLDALLKQKGLKLDDACDRVVMYEANADKLGALVEQGTLNKAEVDACYPLQTPQLRVTKK